MNVERGALNKVLVPGRKLADNYTLRFTRKLDNGATVRTCVTATEGNARGPLLLPFTETSTPSDTDEVTLHEGDHLLEVLIAMESGGGDFSDDFNDDFLTIGATTYQRVWSEQVRVD